MLPKISVVLCTFNRARMLSIALDSLITQSLTRSTYEIVVVDNASTDNTRVVVNALQEKHASPEIILVWEPMQGLAHARNTGWKTARGRYLAFIDDDCIASEDWLQTIVDSYENVRPQPLSVGGLILPKYDGPKPIWFKNRYETDTWGDEPRFLRKGESFTGCNMSFRKEVLERFGDFDVTFGMRGEKLDLAEETNVFRKIWSTEKETCKCYYTPKAVVYHTIDTYKMTVSYQLKRALMAGQASHSMAQVDSGFRRCAIFFGSLALVIYQSISALLGVRPRQNWRNWAVEELYPVASHCGRLLAFCGVKLAFRQRANQSHLPSPRIKPHSSYAS